MATGSLAKSLSKLNLSEEHTVLICRVVATGSQIVTSLRFLDEQYGLPANVMHTVHEWIVLMIALEHSLL